MCGGEAHRHNTRKGETRRLIGGWWVAVVCVGGGGVWWCVVVVVVVVVVLGYQRCARPAKNLNSTPTPRADRAWCGWPLAGEAEGYDCVARAQQPSYRGGRAGGGGTRGGGARATPGALHRGRSGWQHLGQRRWRALATALVTFIVAGRGARVTAAGLAALQGIVGS